MPKLRPCHTQSCKAAFSSGRGVFLRKKIQEISSFKKKGKELCKIRNGSSIQINNAIIKIKILQNYLSSLKKSDGGDGFWMAN